MGCAGEREGGGTGFEMEKNDSLKFFKKEKGSPLNLFWYSY